MEQDLSLLTIEELQALMVQYDKQRGLYWLESQRRDNLEKYANVSIGDCFYKSSRKYSTAELVKVIGFTDDTHQPICLVVDVYENSITFGNGVNRGLDYKGKKITLEKFIKLWDKYAKMVAKAGEAQDAIVAP